MLEFFVVSVVFVCWVGVEMCELVVGQVFVVDVQELGQCCGDCLWCQVSVGIGCYCSEGQGEQYDQQCLCYEEVEDFVLVVLLVFVQIMVVFVFGFVMDLVLQVQC